MLSKTPKQVLKYFSSSTKSKGDRIKETCAKNTIYSWSAQNKINPIVIDKAEGCFFWDYNNKKYFDLNSGLMCTNVGHNHPKIIKGIKDQLDKLSFAAPQFATEIRAKASESIAKFMPGDLKKLFFTLGGAEANENAIKFAKFYTGRNKIMTRYRSYHGATLGAITLTGDYRRWPNEPALPGVLRTFTPYKYRCPIWEKGMSDEQYADKLINILEYQLIFENPESFAAVFIEPITGTNGILIPPADYLPKLRKLCDKYGILLVCDEVMSGFGRTGKTFAVDHWNVVPDIITCAKGLTAAHLPLGMCAVSQKIAKKFEEVTFSGGLTYQAHPASLAAALACMEVMEEEKVVENSEKMGKVMRQLMEEMKDKHPSVGDIRSIGLFGCIELVKNRETREPFSHYPNSSEVMTKIIEYLKVNGVYTYAFTNYFMTNPPLTVKEHELRDVFKIIDKSLEISDKCVI